LSEQKEVRVSGWKIVAVIAASTLALAACGKSGGSGDTDTCNPKGGSQATAVKTVKLVSDPNTIGRFDPKEITVKAGESIEFDWIDGDASHTVTADSGSFDSGLCSKGTKFIVTFNAVGKVPYKCTIHSQMLGTVNVTS